MTITVFKQAIQADWHESSDDIRGAVRTTACDGFEYSARYLYRASRCLMRRVGVNSPVELFDILRQIFWNSDDGVSFGDHCSVGFGTVDRRRQVCDFVQQHAGEPTNIIAMAYEHEYGFSAGIVEIWIDLFASPECVSISSWLGLEARQPGDVDAALSGNASRELDSHCDAVTAFFARELVDPICDADLLRHRFSYEFANGPEAARFDQGLLAAGYYEDRGLLFKEGMTPRERFARLIADHSSFARGDAGFEDAVWNHRVFRSVLAKALESHRLFHYDESSYLSFARLHSVLGIRLAEIESYSHHVASIAADGVPFTVMSLRASGESSHALDAYEMPVPFYEGLLEVSGLFRSCTLAGNKIFVVGDGGRISAASFIRWFVAQHEGIDREKLPRSLLAEFGITCPSVNLAAVVNNSGVFYDDMGDAYFSSIERWKKEVHDELAG